MTIMVALLVAFHVVPAEVSTFRMEYPKGHEVTYTRQNATTWEAKGPNPDEDNGVYKMDGEKLVLKSPDQMTITPDAGWGLRPDTRWNDLTVLKHGADDRIDISKTATSIVFTIKEGTSDTVKATVSWKSEKDK